MRIAGILIAVLPGRALVSGCKIRGTTCKQDNKDYAGAQELPPLKAPPGLEPPDTRNALQVPAARHPGASARQERGLPRRAAAVRQPQGPGRARSPKLAGLFAIIRTP